MRNIQWLLLAFVFCLALSACDPDKVYEIDKTIDEDSWCSNNIMKFNVPVTDTSARYNFYLDIRVGVEYKYANLFLFMKTLYPSGQISVDTIECFLAGPDGRWLGTKSGTLIDNRILLRSKLKYPLPGTYSFEFEQAMRDTVLEHVRNFGIRIEKADEQNEGK